MGRRASERGPQDGSLVRRAGDIKDAEAHYFRGQARQGLGVTEGAVEDYEFALGMDPEYERARATLQSLGVSGY